MYVDDLDVFVTVMLLEESLAVLSLCLVYEKWATPMNGKGRVSTVEKRRRSDAPVAAKAAKDAGE